MRLLLPALDAAATTRLLLSVTPTAAPATVEALRAAQAAAKAVKARSRTESENRQASVIEHMQKIIAESAGAEVRASRRREGASWPSVPCEAAGVALPDAAPRR